MGEPSIMQRLLREKALGRYLNALERGDISTIISVLEQAERDMVLERMILEVHETYQTEEAFLAMVQEESLMEFKEGVHKSHLKGQSELPEEKLLPVPGRRPGRYTRILQALAAMLIVVCLLGGVLVYLQVQNNSLQRDTQTAGNVYNWCVSSGAVIDSTAGVAQLNSIVAISADDIWAVGSLNKGEFATNSYRSTPLIEHWNGSEWSMVPGADITPALNKLAGSIRGPTNGGESVNSLSAISATDIWAVGSENVYLMNSGFQPIDSSFIEHWDGQHWQLVPGSERGGSSLNSVVAISANDVWAVGSLTSSNDITQARPLVEHWDGHRWNSVHLPPWLAEGHLNAVSATSANDVWITGAATIIQPVKALVAHWNGQTWTGVTQPANLLDGTLSSVYAISPNDAWIVGMANDPIHSSYGLPVFGHWDGHTWNVSRGAAGVSRDSSLYALGGNGANDVWAVGSTESGQTLLIEHWNGQSWQLQHQQKPAPGYLSGVAVVHGRVWTVGSMVTVSNAQYTFKGTLIESSC